MASNTVLLVFANCDILDFLARRCRGDFVWRNAAVQS